ncbi:ATP-grasp domain-containing protein [Paracoccus salsus]|uniref:ATP-grasp domain-containing protein n=1 Tax=Paracoccus salsus TaxID=2911061 RepID=UPI001F1BFC13|nr:ATP-grasp domain-containing protein [Paracoccus salsus]MCF3975073.1 ATP-grasp domain-containing protein [Paracoccus salsus]
MAKHFSLGIFTPPEIRHLGALIGDPDAPRIIALSTSAVFGDRTLISRFNDRDWRSIDSGFQGHLYTRPGDCLIVRAPSDVPNVGEQVVGALAVNCEIWQRLTGIALVPPDGRVVLAGDRRPSPEVVLPKNFEWRVGALLEVAVSVFRESGIALLAFTLDERLLAEFGAQPSSVATTTTTIMDKNCATRLLNRHGVSCPETHIFEGDGDPMQVVAGLSQRERYVLKPAGGAAGFGVFSNHGAGATPEQLHRHLGALRTAGRLPGRFQIQVFVPGESLGVVGFVHAQDRPEIFDIHRQIIEGDRFVGASWTPELETRERERVECLYRQLANIEGELCPVGLLCLDMIDGHVIDVNPRLTAGAPIAHLLRLESRLAQHRGPGFRIERIDLNTKVAIPSRLINEGAVLNAVETVWDEHQVLVLPQGLDPFNPSKIVFVNDNAEGAGQRRFRALVDQPG